MMLHYLISQLHVICSLWKEKMHYGHFTFVSIWHINLKYTVQFKYMR